MYEIINDTIVIHRAIRVQNTVRANFRTSLYDRAGHDDRPMADIGRRGNDCRWMNQGGIAGGSSAQGFALTVAVITHGNDGAISGAFACHEKVQDYSGVAAVTNQFDHLALTAPLGYSGSSCYVPVNQWSRDGNVTPCAVSNAAARSVWSLNSLRLIVVGVVVVRFGIS